MIELLNYLVELVGDFLGNFLSDFLDAFDLDTLNNAFTHGAYLGIILCTENYPNVCFLGELRTP